MIRSPVRATGLTLRPITMLEPFTVLADALTSEGVGVLRYEGLAEEALQVAEAIDPSLREASDELLIAMLLDTLGRP